ncbi:MAG: hydrogenase formation protein HypD [Alphaproteobacteria bacterium]|nr:hydrogenase formation protein HypD [Alphaproteobacteria bacterium]
MNFRDEYRDADAARRFANAIRGIVTRPWTLMEVCGGQTHAILRFGVDRLLPPEVSLLHGPGCPVCVTPAEYIDKAIEIASSRNTILCSFGDMLRAPGTKGDLFAAKSRGANVRIVYSPLDAVTIAQAEPDRDVVFFAIGFETTAPANAMAAIHAKQSGVNNFSMLSSHALVPPAIRSLLEAPGARVQGFLAAGHVCTVMGYREYEPIAERFGVPIVVTGFEPLDILQGVYMCLRQLEDGRAVVENQYSRAVRRDGNEAARRVMREVFQVAPRRWRGVGDIPESGLSFTEAYADFDAERRFGAVMTRDDAADLCIAGQVLRGDRKPTDCPAFGKSCTPERPLGVTMVSNEGACAAYYRYRSLETMDAAQ